MHTLKLLFTIVDRNKGKSAAELLSRYSIPVHHVMLANGTAHKDILGTLGLSDTAKDIVLSFLPAEEGRVAMAHLSRALDIDLPGKGIAFTVALNGVAGPETLKKITGGRELAAAREDDGMEETHDLVIAIVNNGFTDVVMDAARPAGARGGTVVHARGAGSMEASKFLGITIEPEKDIVLILTERKDRNAIMTAIAKAAGLNSEGKGLVFSLPAGDVMGVARQQNYNEAL